MCTVRSDGRVKPGMTMERSCHRNRRSAARPARRQSHARRRRRAGAGRSARGADLLAQSSAVGALDPVEPAGAALRPPRAAQGHPHRAVRRRRRPGRARRRKFSPPRATPTCRICKAASPPGKRPASNCSPASTCRARRSANTSSTPATRRASPPRNSTRLMRSGTDMVVVDSRPFDEFQRVSIPSATNVPGAELVLRIHDIAPSPDTLVVVNCAGRTRSIIGAQSLINAGLPNKVVALRNGTMGWSLAGLMPDSGKAKRFTEPSDRRPRLRQGRGGARRQEVRRHADRHEGAGGLPRRRDPHALCVRRARSDRIRRRAFPRRGQRARRPACAGDRPVCRPRSARGWC